MRFVRYIVIVSVALTLFFFARNVYKMDADRVAQYAEIIQYNDAELVINESVVLDVAIAQTPGERIRGLSRQQGLQENQGLLFRFPDVGMHGIWMRDMYFAIDIIWLDEDFTVVDIKKDAIPESYRSEFDAEVFQPQAPALYVLEVLSGFVDTNRVSVGDIFSLREKSKK